MRAVVPTSRLLSSCTTMCTLFGITLWLAGSLAADDSTNEGSPPTLADLLRVAEQHPRIDARHLRRVAEDTAVDENLIAFMPRLVLRGAGGQRVDPVLGPFYSHYMPYAAATSQTLNSEVALRGRAPIGTNYHVSAGAGLVASDDLAAPLSPRFEPTVRLRIEQPMWRGMWPSVLLAPVAQAEARVSAEEAATRQAHFDILLATAEGYLAAARSESIAELRRRTLVFARQFEALTRELIAGGKLSRLDLAVTVQTVAAREADVSLAELDAIRARLALMNTIGVIENDTLIASLRFDLDTVAEWPVPEVSVDESLKMAIEYSPEVALIAAQKQRVGAAIVEAADTVRPDIRLTVDGAWGGVAGVNRCPNGYLADGFTPCAVPAVYDGGFDRAVINMGVRPLYQVQVGIEADLPTWFPPSTARERSLHHDQASLDAERRAVTRQLAWIVERNVTDVQRGQLLLTVSERAVALAREALAAEQTKHKAGRATSFDVLRAQDLLVQAEQGVVESRYQLAIAIVRLRALRGELRPEMAALFPQAPPTEKRAFADVPPPSTTEERAAPPGDAVSDDERPPPRKRR
jgi:outer membrane protein TolC